MTGLNDAKPEARLLVVEDEPNILELLPASLRLAGFEVAPGGTGGRGGMGGRSTGGSDAARQISAWVAETFTATSVGGATVYDLAAG